MTTKIVPMRKPKLTMKQENMRLRHIIKELYKTIDHHELELHKEIDKRCQVQSKLEIIGSLLKPYVTGVPN